MTDPLEADDVICQEPSCDNYEDFTADEICVREHRRNPNGPFRDGRVWVVNNKCTTCIFRPGNKMHLNTNTVETMVADCITQDRVIPCHLTLDGPRSVCRGLWDVHRGQIRTLVLAEAMGLVEFDDLPEELS